MSKRPRLAIVFSLLSAVVSFGCAMVQTSDVTDPGSTPKGVRVYTPRILVMVDSKVTGGGQTQVLTLPDLCRAYDVRPLTIFAKQDFKIELDDGAQLKALTANQDTTSILSFIKEAATLAAKGAGVPVGAQTIAGTFGLPDGVYQYGDQGQLVLLYDKSSPPAKGLAAAGCK